MELFSKAAKKAKKAKRAPEATEPAPKKAKRAEAACDDASLEGSSSTASFEDIGLKPWLCESCSAMGLKWPTPIQVACIPRVLGSSTDLLALAETGSGKTAAFALPLLQQLFDDPYGVFCLVLSPARELAVQIAEQFEALGARANVRVCTVMGGEDTTKQSNTLHNTRPHVVVATPGRLAEILRYSGEIRAVFARVHTLVLDEADRVLSPSMAEDVGEILSALPPPGGTAGSRQTRRTLFFSATLSEALKRVPEERSADFGAAVHRVDLSTRVAVPAGLAQEYIFMPNRVKLTYFLGLLKALGVQASEDATARVTKKDGKKKKPSTTRLGTGVESCIVFVQTCKRAHEVHSLLLTLGVKSLTLHSKLGQRRRLAALAKFKSRLAHLLVCTDVASRGLDIPAVELVVNYDVPRVPDDYIHRVGRTARAGAPGRSVTLVTQRDVELLHNIEARVSAKLTLCPELKEKDVLALLNPVGKAMVEAQKRYPWTEDDNGR